MARKTAPSSSAKSGASVVDASMRIVVLKGTERFLTEEFTRRLAKALDEKFGGIEQFTFDGETASPAVVLDELRSYGLMQKHKLVILDNADVFLAGGVKVEDDDEKKSGPSVQRRLMERYAENPVPDATLLMRADTWRPGNLDKLIANCGAIISCEPPSTEKAIGWCMARAPKAHGIAIESDAAELLVGRHGTALQRLDTELEKLAAMAGPGKSITRQLVSDNTVLSKEEKFWVLQDAIATADPAIMLNKLHEMTDVSLHDLVPLTWSASDFLRKVHAAGQLLRQGVPSNAIFGQLKLWGGSGGAVLDWGKKLSSRTAAQLLQAAIDVDRHGKSGLGEPMRNLEALMVRIADTVNV